MMKSNFGPFGTAWTRWMEIADSFFLLVVSIMSPSNKSWPVYVARTAYSVPSSSTQNIISPFFMRNESRRCFNSSPVILILFSFNLYLLMKKTDKGLLENILYLLEEAAASGIYFLTGYFSILFEEFFLSGAKFLWNLNIYCYNLITRAVTPEVRNPFTLYS